MSEILKLGTRRSLLATIQSTWVARQIEGLNPNVKVELVGIETQGDRITDIPLHQMDGKEFFVAELDQALLSEKVDFTVHSLKDLSLERPDEICLAAIPSRENPRDAIVFSEKILDKLRAGRTLKIGTSSPRRLENLPAFLEKALPGFSGHVPSMQWFEIRGNVNTRLKRILEPENSERHLDAVVLALAGLNRIWADSKGQQELKELLHGIRWMVLPLTHCPAAAGQGALAVECRKSDSRAFQIIHKLHDESTADQILAERKILEDWGGGCHQKFGVTSVYLQEQGHFLLIRGKKPDGSFVNEIRWNAPIQPSGQIRAWDGVKFRAEDSLTHKALSHKLPDSFSAVFVAHSRAFPEGKTIQEKNPRIWTSGVSSWFRLAKEGIWVEGCAEGFGFDFLRPTLKAPALQLPSFEDWLILTHEDAGDGWPVGQVISTYRVEHAMQENSLVKESLEKATHVFWGSSSQFDTFGEWVNPDACHSTGPGKTGRYLREKGIRNLKIFPSVEEWRKWLN